MLREFRDFIARGNVMDMAVGIIIGAAFTGIVNSLVGDIVNPIIGLFIGGIDFSDMALRLGSGDGGAVLAYGKFLMAVINFLIIAWVVFVLVKGVNRVKDSVMAAVEQGGEEEAPKPPTEIELLTQIRDLLQTPPRA